MKPHSIYFEMLGEHGFVGFAIFMALFLSVWITASRDQKGCQKGRRVRMGFNLNVNESGEPGGLCHRGGFPWVRIF